MVFSFSARLAALLCLVALPTTLAANIDVTVGGVNILAFNPESVTANVGDVVRFSFRQKNHTATQSSLASPCSKLAGGFDSGFVPVSANNTNGPFPVAEYTVTSNDPVWVYCRQATHCSSAGMVFAINPGDKFNQFKAAATAGASSTSSVPPTATAVPPSTGPTNHLVVVGGTGVLAYTPNDIQASPGDTVTFQFQQKNHTVTQSSFANPCVPLTETSTTGQIGLDSGFMPVSSTATQFPTWTITINNTSPLWFFCRQTGHCGQGMVMAINADDSSANSFSAFQAKAMQMNGTSSSGGSPPGTSGALRIGAGNSLALMMFGLVAGLML